MDYQRALQLAPDDPLPSAFKGLLNIQGGRNAQAAAALEAGINRSKTPNAWLYYLLARALYQEGEMTPKIRHAFARRSKKRFASTPTSRMRMDWPA